MNTPTHLEFDAPPRNAMAVLRSVLAARPTQATPAARAVSLNGVWRGARAPADLLARYRAVCGLPSNGVLPALYVHALAMPLHMAMLSHPRFPLRLLGMVHLANAVESLHPIADAATLEFRCALDGIHETERGQSFEITTTAHVDGAVAWRERSTFLSPLPRASGSRRTASADDTSGWGPTLQEWSVPANAGRRFAGPSGDWNPIHISAITARMFGFPRAIGHGMFSAARCVAALQNLHPAPGPLRIDLRFKRPLLLPGQVALHAQADGAAHRFVLRVLPTGEPHIEGIYGPL